MAISRFKFHR
jgi:hypothetical protein